MSLGYNLLTELLMGGLLVALGVVLNPSFGVALMIVQMCLILGNAYRFQQKALVDTALLPQVIDEMSEAEPSILAAPALTYQHGVTSLWTSPAALNESPLLQHPLRF